MTRSRNCRQNAPGNPFDPAAPLCTFDPNLAPHLRRRPRDLAVLFVEEPGLGRFVVKSFQKPGENLLRARERAQRELQGIRAFTELGVGALGPVFGPVDQLHLVIDGWRTSVGCAMVFPFLSAPTLRDMIASAEDPAERIREAGERIAARHERARRLSEIHSDGGAQNVFADWVWMDFSELDASACLAEAKAHEVQRFLSSIVEVSRAGRSVPHVRAFCEGYRDREVFVRVLSSLRPKRAPGRIGYGLKLLARPHRLVEMWFGPSTGFRRLRTWYALACVL